MRRWWNPAQWRDEHPGAAGAASDRPLSERERLDDRLRDRHGREVLEDRGRPVPRLDPDERRRP